jgi:hypothetical protein
MLPEKSPMIWAGISGRQWSQKKTLEFYLINAAISEVLFLALYSSFGFRDLSRFALS